MTVSLTWLKRVLFHTWRWAFLLVPLGMVLGSVGCWALINATDGPGVTVQDQSEAEGPEFADPNTVDLVSHIKRRRVCPSRTQRYAWRWINYHGERAQQAVPLESTEMPFLAADGTLVITVPAGHVPDKDQPGWMVRTVTGETCSLLPNWLGNLFGGTRVMVSPDMPVNFVGATHDPVQPADHP